MIVDPFVVECFDGFFQLAVCTNEVCAVVFGLPLLEQNHLAAKMKESVDKSFANSK